MEQSPATNATFLQVRQSDASGNSSFLPGLEEALLTRSLSFSASLTALTQNPAKPRNLKKRHFSLPPLFLAPFPEAKQQRGAVCWFVFLFFWLFFVLLLEAGVETYAEQHQI